MRDAPTPNPGSDEALELGCRCPVLHNAHGRGAMGTSGDDAEFWTNAACPLHGATISDPKDTPITITSPTSPSRTARTPCGPTRTTPAPCWRRSVEP